MQPRNDHNKHMSQIEHKLAALLFDEAFTWISQIDAEQSHWETALFNQRQGMAIIGIMHKRLNKGFTGLFCVQHEPELLAVSFVDSKLGQLNPYIEGGQKLESDLDGLSCWNILAVMTRPEKNARAVRFLRDGCDWEVAVNHYGYLEIIDWNSLKPVDEFLAIQIHDHWHEPAVPVLPFSVKHFCHCWRQAVKSDTDMKNRWNEWMTAAFAELGGKDRARLQHMIMGALAVEDDSAYFEAFRHERRRFLKREREPLKQLFPSV